MFFCGISGEPPQDPVVSAKSGHVYERRLILKYINDNGTDPLTGEKLDESDLLSVKASPSLPPRPPPSLRSPSPRPKGCTPETTHRDRHPHTPPHPSKRMGRARVGNVCAETTVQQHQARAQLCSLRSGRSQSRRCPSHPRTRRRQRVRPLLPSPCPCPNDRRAGHWPTYRLAWAFLPHQPTVQTSK